MSNKESNIPIKLQSDLDKAAIQKDMNAKFTLMNPQIPLALHGSDTRHKKHVRFAPI